MNRRVSTKKRTIITLAICAILAVSSIMLLQMNKTTEAALIDPHPGLVAWWTFDEGSGAMAKDSSQFGNDATISGASWIDGKFGKALSFDGVDDYVSIADSSSLDLTSEGTVTFWFMPKELGRLQHLIAKSGAYDVYLNSNNRIYVRKTSLPNENAYSNSLTVDNLNEWLFIAGVFDHATSNKVKIFVNGIPIGEADLNNDLQSSANNLAIGAWSSGTADFTNGVLDEVRIYNRVLSESEILESFQQNPNFSSKLLAQIPEGASEVIVTLTWQGFGDIEITIDSPTQTYTEDTLPFYQKNSYDGNSSENLNIKRIPISVSSLASDEDWYITLDIAEVEEYRITVEVQK